MDDYTDLMQFDFTYEFNVYVDLISGKNASQVDYWDAIIVRVNSIYPTVFLIVGIVGNFLQIFIYKNLKNTSKRNVYMPIMSLMNIFSMILSSVNEFQFLLAFKSYARFKYRCVIISYVLRLTSAISCIIFSFSPLIAVLNLEVSLLKNLLVLLVLALLSLIKLLISECNLLNDAYYVCVMTNDKFILLKDCVDFLTFYLIPIVFYYFSQIRIWRLLLKSKKNLNLSLKKFLLIDKLQQFVFSFLITPLIFSFFNFSVVFMPLLVRFTFVLQDSAYSRNEDENGKWKFLKYLTVIVYQSHFVSTFLMSFIHNSHFRKKTLSYFSRSGWSGVDNNFTLPSKKIDCAYRSV